MNGDEARDLVAAMKAEDAAWRDLPFVDGETPWAPQPIPGEDDRARDARSVLGAQYALEFIAHLRTYSQFDVWSLLPDIVAVIAGRGLDPTEWAFLNTVAQFIATGRVTLAGGFDAVPAPDGPAEAERPAA